MTLTTSFVPLIALFTVSSLLRTACVSLITVPKNTVAKFGDKIQLKCSTNETISDQTGFSTNTTNKSIPLDWTFSAVNSSTNEFIYKSGIVAHTLSSKYALDNTTLGRFDLIIKSVDLSFAGTYTCSEPQLEDEISHMASAELIVLAFEPVCSTNASTEVKEGDYIEMWCTVNYSGNWIPEMEWTRNDGQNVNADFRFTNASTAAASILIKRLDFNDNGVTFTCLICAKSFGTENRTLRPDEAFATNIPNCQHVWNYTLTVASRSGSASQPNADQIVFIGTSVASVILLIAIVTIICRLRKREKTKPDVVPQVDQNNYDDSDLHQRQSQNNPPLYAEVQISSNGFQVVENHPMPVYASVKKENIVFEKNKDAVSNNHQSKQSIPVYAEVTKLEKETKEPGPSRQFPLSTDTKPKQNYSGADGTQYMEMNLLSEPESNGVSVKRPPLFSLVETYASIDHTMAAPPPPPPHLPRRL